MAIEIVRFNSKNCDFHSCVSLPEGKSAKSPSPSQQTMAFHCLWGMLKAAVDCGLPGKRNILFYSCCTCHLYHWHLHGCIKHKCVTEDDTSIKVSVSIYIYTYDNLCICTSSIHSCNYIDVSFGHWYPEEHRISPVLRFSDVPAVDDAFQYAFPGFQRCDGHL